MTDRLTQALDELEAAIIADGELPTELRGRALVLVSSMGDYVFWIHRRAQEGDLSDNPADQMYYALEVETGVGAWGVTPREAVDNYFRQDARG